MRLSPNGAVSPEAQGINPGVREMATAQSPERAIHYPDWRMNRPFQALIVSLLAVAGLPVHTAAKAACRGLMRALRILNLSAD